MPTNDGWENEARVYTKIKNVTKNSKIVISTLSGMELYPGQEFDLRTSFRKAQVVDAAHEISSLIRTGHLKDVSEGAAENAVPVASGGMPTKEEMQKRMKTAILREVADCTNVGQLDDWMASADKEIAEAAKLRYDIINGIRKDDGEFIPGREEEEAKPTELIRSVGDGTPVAVAEAPARSTTAAGLVKRVQ